MKISRITIKNFKSIKEIAIDCNKEINAFIGKNGTGKSAVFEAVNFLLGESFPTINSFNKGWYIKGKEKACLIEIVFQNTTTMIFDTSLSMYHFKITNPSNVTNTFNVTNTIKSDDATRTLYKINYLGSDRNIKSIMPTNSYSLLGKYLYDSDLFENVRREFENKMKEANEILQSVRDYKNFIESIGTHFAKQIGRNAGDDKLETKSEVYDTKHFLKTLEFYTNDGINLQNHGSGIQNSFIIACLRALSEHRETDTNPIFIDEPELYLHPHAKKALYNTLQDLAKAGVQIFYITHSAEFLSYHKSEEIFRFYVDGENGTKVAKGKNESGAGNLIQLNNNKISYNEAFFADTVFVCEGFSDYLFLKHIIELKTEKTIEICNISILDAGGKYNLKSVYEAYKNLEIQTFVLYDKDNKQNDTTNAILETLNGYGFEENLDVFLENAKAGNKELSSDCKIYKTKEWLENNTPEKQEKIDLIWKKIMDAIKMV